MHLFWLYSTVSVLALLATGFMRFGAPAAALLRGGLHGLALRRLGRGLELQAATPTAQAHAVMLGSFRGRTLRLQLGAGRLHVQLQAVRDLGWAPLDLADFHTRMYSRRLLHGHEPEFGASSLMLQIPVHQLRRRSELLRILDQLHSIMQEVEQALVSPDALAATVANRHLPSRLRARSLEYRCDRFEDAPGTLELLVEARDDASPELRIAAARRLGAAGADTLREMSLHPERLSGRNQRALIDALLQTKPEPLQPLLEVIAARARSKTLLYLLSRAAARPEALPTARAILKRTDARRENGVAARMQALALLEHEHALEAWREDAVEILGNEHEPASLRQACLDALVASGARSSAIEVLRTIAMRTVPLRGWAIAAVARLRGADEASWLFELAERDISARMPVLLAFSDLGGEGESWLLQCLESKSALVLEQALGHLETYGTIRAVAPLRHLRARLAGAPPPRPLLPSIDRCIRAITARYQGTTGLNGGLSMSEPSEHQGHLALAPPVGSLSELNDRARPRRR